MMVAGVSRSLLKYLFFFKVQSSVMEQCQSFQGLSAQRDPEATFQAKSSLLSVQYRHNSSQPLQSHNIHIAFGCVRVRNACRWIFACVCWCVSTYSLHAGVGFYEWILFVDTLECLCVQGGMQAPLRRGNWQVLCFSSLFCLVFSSLRMFSYRISKESLVNPEMNK